MAGAGRGFLLGCASVRRASREQTLAATRFMGTAVKSSPEEPRPRRTGLMSRLVKTREALTRRLVGIFSPGAALDDDWFDEIEDQLIMADVGVGPTRTIVEALRVAAREQRLQSAEDLLGVVRAKMRDLLAPAGQPLVIDGQREPFVILMVGVNGVGKTTTVAKLAHQLKQDGHSVMLAACDTYRAAAVEQLQAWGQRLDVPVVAQRHGADAAAVAHDALRSAQARHASVLIVDTAGRQHTHGDLMEQLVKVRRVIAKIDETAPHETLLTVDAGNGQNVLAQVQQFHSRLGLTGLCVTKLDGTAKGGVVLALCDRFSIPVRYVGVGEAVTDFRPFDAEEFVDALMPRPAGSSTSDR